MLRLCGKLGFNVLAMIVLLVLFTSCNQNPAFVSGPVIAPPPGTIPVPPGILTLPVGPYPTGLTTGGFNPVLPPGMPPQFYAFLPVYNYFQQSSYLQSYWASLWNQWQQYAYVNNYNPYNFIPFWYEFCPTQWASGSWLELYSFFDYTVYGWMSPQMILAPSVSPSVFWQYYIGMPYSPLNQLGIF